MFRDEFSDSDACPLCGTNCNVIQYPQALGEGLGKEVVVPANPDTFMCKEPVWRDGVLVHAKGAVIPAAEARELGLLGEEGRAHRPAEDRARRPQEDR